MYETLLIPTAIPHRCSFGSFIGLHFNLFFFSCFPPTLPPTLPSSFILCMSLFQPIAHSFSPPSFLELLWALGTPVTQARKAEFLLNLDYRPWAVMDIGAADNGRSVPLMTPAHCGHLEVPIGQCNYESHFCNKLRGYHTITMYRQYTSSDKF